MRLVVRAAGVAAIIALVAACGGGGGGDVLVGTGGTGGTGAGAGAKCSMGTFCMLAGSFEPSSAIVARNSTVTWVNNSGVTHNVVFDNPAAALSVGGASSGNLGISSSGSQARTFSAAGTYPFHCTIHVGMSGDVTVQ